MNLLKIIFQDYFKDFQGNLGGLADTVAKCIEQLDDAGLIENLFNVAGEFAEEVNKFLKELQDDGTLDKFAQDFPKLVKASLDYELAKVKALTACEPLIPYAVWFLEKLTDFIDYIFDKEGLSDDIQKSFDSVAYETPEGIVKPKEVDFGIATARDAETKTKTYSDADVESLINANKNITTKQKETVKETIEKDGINNYTITVNGNTSDNEIIRKIIDEIERIQKNR